MSKEEKLSQEPDTAFMTTFPKYQDKLQRTIETRYPLLESRYKRPTQGPMYCEIEYFAYDLCRRNMNAFYAKQMCRKEKEDLNECKFAEKRMAKSDILTAASKKVGDRVPELYGGSSKWMF